MKESDFQRNLIKKLKDRFPGCYVMKNDANHRAGIPDLTILYESYWATLECKKSKTATHRPHQDRNVEKMNQMSFSAFIYPENEEEVIDEMERSFRSHKGR